MDQKALSISVGFIGVILSYFFGEWTPLLSLFLFAMLLDYVTGVAASLKEGHGLNSSVGFWGLIKKALALAAVSFAHQIDGVAGTDLIMVGAIYTFLANEFISLTENYGRLGLPLPSVIKEAITVLKKKG